MSSDEAVEAAIERVAQSLMEAQYPPGTVQDGCLSPVWAEWVADPDPDAQSFVEAYRAMARPDPSILAAVRAEVANEIRTHAGPLNDRGIRVGVQDWSADRGQGYTSAIGEVLDLLAVDPLSPPEPRLPIPPSV